MLHQKTFIEEHQRQAQGQLEARLEMLKSKGMDDKTILKDAKVKQFKALVRKAKRRLDSIAAMQTLASTKKATKAQKAAAAKATDQEPPKPKKIAAPKKPKKARKPAAGEE